jgi:DNA transposition AAA+ family ATPase
MADNDKAHKAQQPRTTPPARLRIMKFTLSALVTAQQEEGMVALIGDAGLGKTFSAQHCLAMSKGHYLRASVHWTPKAFLATLLDDLGEPLKLESHNLHTLMRAAKAALRRYPFPLIIDESDMLFELNGRATENAQRKVETIRELYDATGVPVLFIGEERLDTKTRQWERLHSRISEWVRAPAADLDDARLLAPVYAPGLQVADDLLDHLVKKTRGSVRRIEKNLKSIARAASALDAQEADLQWFAGAGLTVSTGDVMRRGGEA